MHYYAPIKIQFKVFTFNFAVHEHICKQNKISGLSMAARSIHLHQITLANKFPEVNRNIENIFLYSYYHKYLPKKYK